MAFAQPFALLFFLLFVPIILLYLLKQRRRRVEVSTLLFWDQILRDEHSVTSITHLRRLLSLLLQLLIVTLLALALARPVFSKDLLGGRRLVVLLDQSASMTTMEEGKTRFEEARAVADGILRNMSLGDTGMLVAVGAHPDIVVAQTDSRKELLEGLERVFVTHEKTNFADAVKLLHNLPPDPRETHVHLITDGAFPAVDFKAPENMAFATHIVGKAKENVGISSFQLRPLPASPRDFEILFEARNYTETDVNAPFEVRVAGRLVDAGELLIAANSSAVRTVRQFTQSGGEVEVALDHPDAFLLDNTVYAVLPVPEPFRVVLVTAGNLFLESALLTDDEIELSVISPADYPGVEGTLEHPVSEYTFVFDGWTPETPPAADAVYLGQWPPALGVERGGELADPLITDWDHEHPINQHLHLTNVKLGKAIHVNPAEGWTTLIQGMEQPLALYLDAEPASLVLAFDTQSTDLPLRVAFPILIANAVRHMAGADQVAAWESPPIGEVLTASQVEDLRSARVHSGENQTEQEPYLVLAPGDAAPPPEELAAGLADPDRGKALLAVRLAGIYRAVDKDAQTTPLFGANLNDAAESDIRPAEGPVLKSETPLPVVEDGVRLSMEPWLLLAMLGICMLGGEWYLFHRRWVE